MISKGREFEPHREQFIFVFFGNWKFDFAYGSISKCRQVSAVVAIVIRILVILVSAA